MYMAATSPPLAPVDCPDDRREWAALRTLGNIQALLFAIIQTWAEGLDGVNTPGGLVGGYTP